MEMYKWFEKLPDLLAAMGFPAQLVEGPRVLWAMTPERTQKEDAPMMGEMFLASSLGLTPPEDVDYLQGSVVFMRDILPDQLESLRAFCTLLNRKITGGYFSAMEAADGSCFLEYAFSLVLYKEAAAYQNNRLVEVSVDLAEAYLTLSREAFSGLAQGRMDVTAALERLDQEA